MILELLEAPVEEPISLEEALAHLRLGTAEDAVQVQGLIRAAREQIEARTGVTLCKTKWRAYFNYWPLLRYTALPKPPLLSVHSIRYLRATHTGTIYDSSYYPLANEFWSVEPVGPNATRLLRCEAHERLPKLMQIEKAVRIDFYSGAESPAHIPQGLRIAMLMLLRDLYDQVTEPNSALESLILQYRHSGFIG